MANPPSVLAGTIMASDTTGEAAVSYLDTLGGSGATPLDQIGNSWGAGTTEGHFSYLGCSINRVIKFVGHTFFAWIAREVRKYNADTGDWEALGGIFPLSDMQSHYTGGGSPRTTYSYHSGLYTLPKSTAPNGVALFGVYMVHGGFGGGTLGIIWSPTGDAGSWQKIDTGISLGRSFFHSIVVWDNKLLINHDKLIVFDPETLAAQILSAPIATSITDCGLSADYCMFKGKLVAVAPRNGSGAGTWSLFEWNGYNWTEKVSLGGVNASQSGSAALFVINAVELTAFLPLGGSPYNYVFTFTEADGIYTPTDRRTAVLDPAGGYEHGLFPEAANGHWQVYIDMWTGARVPYLFYTNAPSAGTTFTFRYNGPGEGLDPINVDNTGSPPFPASSDLAQDVHGWATARRGEGDYTFEEGTVGDLNYVLVEKLERMSTGRRRVHFRVWGSGAATGRVRIKWSPGQDTPEINATGLEAVTGGGTPTIGVTEDYVDGVLNDGSLYTIDWDDTGVVGDNGRISVAVAWGVA